MIYFSTEFPLKSGLSDPDFTQRIVAWLDDIRKSKVISGRSRVDLDSSTGYIYADNGEELRGQSTGENEGKKAIGFRHDIPDEEGRLWRTEVVIRRAVGPGEQDFIRLRTQCIARTADARLDTPKKPFLLKTLLNQGWGGLDGQAPVSDAATWLPNDEDGLRLAKSFTMGEASRHLPVIYISAAQDDTWPLSLKEMKDLAYEMGGIAHVVVEPNRAFSFQLRDRTEGRNVYNGAIGVILPKQGKVHRFLREQLPDSRDLQSSVRSFTITLRSQMPADGWDWMDLQEQVLRLQRERERSRLSAEEMVSLYQKEIDNLKEKITGLEAQVSQPSVMVQRDTTESSSANDIVMNTGSEIYSGELYDRLRAAATKAVNDAERNGLDLRSKVLLSRFAMSPRSKGLCSLLADIGRATRDPGRMADQLPEVLGRYGFKERTRGKHIVLDPRDDLDGTGPITIPTTPGDHRSAKNMQKDVEKVLGLRLL